MTTTETSGSNTVTTTNTATSEIGQNIVGPTCQSAPPSPQCTPGVSPTGSNNVTDCDAQTLSYFGGTQAIYFGEANGFVTLSNTDSNWNSNVVLNPSGVLGVGNVNGLGKGHAPRSMAGLSAAPRLLPMLRVMWPMPTSPSASVAQPSVNLALRDS